MKKLRSAFGAIVGALVLLSAVTLSGQGPTPAQIQAAIRALLAGNNTWTGTNTFNNVVVNGSFTCPMCPETEPGGASGTLQYNDAGVFGGLTGSSVSGNDLTLPDALTVGSMLVATGVDEDKRLLITGKGQGATGGFLYTTHQLIKSSDSSAELGMMIDDPDEADYNQALMGLESNGTWYVAVPAYDAPSANLGKVLTVYANASEQIGGTNPYPAMRIGQYNGVANVILGNLEPPDATLAGGFNWGVGTAPTANNAAVVQLWVSDPGAEDATLNILGGTGDAVTLGAGSVGLGNGGALRSDTTDAHTAKICGYDVNGAAYVCPVTITNANAPTFVLAPSGDLTVALTGNTSSAGAFIGTLTSPAVANIGANSCGTSTATIAGTDNVWTVTVGATAGTACRITFDTTAPTVWKCQVANNTTLTLAATPHQTAGTATTADISGVFTAGDAIDGICIAR